MRRMRIGRLQTVPQAVSLYVGARHTADRLQQFLRPPWSILLNPAVHLIRLRERKALQALIELEPGHSREAEEKLLYLLALMTANAAVLPLSDVQRAIDTLRPYRSGLAEALGRRTLQSASAIPENSRRTPEPSPGRRAG